jgi:hypothetical protein
MHWNQGRLAFIADAVTQQQRLELLAGFALGDLCSLPTTYQVADLSIPSGFGNGHINGVLVHAQINKNCARLSNCEPLCPGRKRPHTGVHNLIAVEGGEYELLATLWRSR